MATLRRATMQVIITLALPALTACATAPSFVLDSRDATAPVGPKVAALVANFKCELLEATTSEEPLYYYRDLPSLPPHEHKGDIATDRKFNLHNIFQEIEYVGQVAFQLDVTNTGAINPTEAFTEFFKPTKGLMPATNLVLSVGGQFSEAAHRQITFDQSVDFSRLVPTPVHPRYAGLDFTQPAKDLPLTESCNHGIELEGTLGLKETLATGLTIAAMNDISVFTNTDSKVAGADTVIKLPETYTFGQIATTIDFTINENANGGPNWTLRHFKGPNGSPGLFNLTRNVVDKITVTFVPVCIREKYAPVSNPDAVPIEYDHPRMVVGTPGWANYLPPCVGKGHAQAQAAALAKAQNNNNTLNLQNALTPLRITP